MEIEKKYLLKDPSFCRDGLACCHITQAYVSRDPVIRVRKSENEDGCRYILTVKGKGLTAHEEIEWELSKESYERLAAKREGRLIEKTRYLLPLADGHTAELDFFEGELAGLVLAEVEFKSFEDMEQFVKPSFFGKDVTRDPRYHNSVLSCEDFIL